VADTYRSKELGAGNVVVTCCHHLTLRAQKVARTMGGILANGQIASSLVSGFLGVPTTSHFGRQLFTPDLNQNLCISLLVWTARSSYAVMQHNLSHLHLCCLAIGTPWFGALRTIRDGDINAGVTTHALGVHAVWLGWVRGCRGGEADLRTAKRKRTFSWAISGVSE